MKEQEAIRRIQDHMVVHKLNEPRAVLITEALRMGIDALEKQILKTPYFEGDGYYNGNLVYDTWRCPNCDSDYEVEFEEHKYCPHCGQAIKWE